MRVPRIMLGAEALGGHDWGDLDIASVERAIKSAIERGLKFFDVADCYGLGQAEERLGQIVKTKRDQV
ncbi:MAG: aldo/keto reductase, partial [Pseudomonadota bacterium]